MSASSSSATRTEPASRICCRPPSCRLPYDLARVEQSREVPGLASDICLGTQLSGSPAPDPTLGGRDPDWHDHFLGPDA